ncbi:hypothetical protein CJ483_02535 [Bacillus sp. PK3_68]|nr:hypothetical protein CJ483_02535 [Bacillus sp. PK3_68]
MKMNKVISFPGEAGGEPSRFSFQSAGLTNLDHYTCFKSPKGVQNKTILNPFCCRVLTVI